MPPSTPLKLIASGEGVVARIDVAEVVAEAVTDVAVAEVVSDVAVTVVREVNVDVAVVVSVLAVLVAR